jgi:hypothetical protein
LAVVVANDEARSVVFDVPRRSEAAVRTIGHGRDLCADNLGDQRTHFAYTAYSAYTACMSLNCFRAADYPQLFQSGGLPAAPALDRLMGEPPTRTALPFEMGALRHE